MTRVAVSRQPGFVLGQKQTFHWPLRSGICSSVTFSEFCTVCLPASMKAVPVVSYT